MKKISIIGTVGVPAIYGGFETLTEHLTERLGKKNQLTVFCSSKSYKEKRETYNNASLRYVNFKANGSQSIPYDIISIFKGLRYSDTLLILGVSGCIILPFVKLFSNKKIIVNIDGLEWKREKWNKYIKLFLKFSEKIAVQYSNVVVTDNKVIKDYVKSEYNITSCLIAYGGDHVSKENLDEIILEEYSFLKDDYAFKVCRIEPENNVHLILEAFSDFKDKKLVIIGNWHNSKYGIDLKNKYFNKNNIYLLDPIYNQKKLNQIRSNCSIYVHGHSAGGTNPSLVEAMSLKLPIFAFGAKYNKETTGYKAKYFDNKEELIDLLFNTNSSDLLTNSEIMKNLADKNYTWEKISNDYNKLF